MSDSIEKETTFMCRPAAHLYRVVYGETIPAWEKTFATRREANAFARKHKSFGDIIFSIKKIVEGERPQSLMAAISEARGEDRSHEGK